MNQTRTQLLTELDQLRRENERLKARLNVPASSATSAAIGDIVTQQHFILSLLDNINRSQTVRTLIQALTTQLRTWLNCDAVGVRLEENEDYPYFETRGFADDFVAAENFLCAKDEHGDIIRGEDGTPVLGCMCGNIIRGRFDPSLDFFTENGSFFSNCTTDLLATTTEKERQAHTRNRCNGEGYESVGLFPLRVGDSNFGLLQINHKAKNLFTPEVLALLETTAYHVAIALAHIKDRTELAEREHNYRTLVESTMAAPWKLDLETGRFTFMGPQVEGMLGYPVEAWRDVDFLFSIMEPTDRERIQNVLNAKEGDGRFDVEYRAYTVEDEMIWVRDYISVVTTADSRAQLFGIKFDITRRKTDEIKLRETVAAKEELLREVNHRVRNNLTAIIGLMHKEEFRAQMHGTSIPDVIRQLTDRIRGIAKVHELLSQSGWRPLLLSRLCSSIIRAALAVTDFEQENLSVTVSNSPIMVNSYQAHHLALVVNELMINVLKYAMKPAEKTLLQVDILGDNGQIQLRFADNGPGFPEDVLMGKYKSENIGFNLIKSIVCESLQGKLCLENNEGAVVTLRFTRLVSPDMEGEESGGTE